MIIAVLVISVGLMSWAFVHALRPGPVDDVLDYYSFRDLMALRKRLTQEYMGKPEQTRMLADVNTRLARMRRIQTIGHA